MVLDFQSRIVHLKQRKYVFMSGQGDLVSRLVEVLPGVVSLLVV